MSAVAERQPTSDAKNNFAHTVNYILLVGAPPVLVGLRALLDEIADSNMSKSADRHDKLLTELMYAIRDDLGIRPNRADDKYQFRLWASTKKSN